MLIILLHYYPKIHYKEMKRVKKNNKLQRLQKIFCEPRKPHL